MTMTADPHAEGHATCGHCGQTFADLQVAIDASGGWCPACDQPARVARLCATGCGLAAQPGDRYCTGCGTATDRQGWAQ
jgi:hypothetical protein